MTISRRHLIAGSAALPWLAACRTLQSENDGGRIRLGICDWSIGARGNPSAFDAARAMGLQGVQISPRRAEDRLSYADAAMQESYREKSRETGVAVASLGLTVTNGCPLATDDRAVSWLEQTIDATQAFGCTAILIAFFGKGDLTRGPELKTKEIDAVVDRLKAVAKRAEKKKVVLGIESYLSARVLLGILDRIASPAVGVYYDIANTHSRGYDCAAEIRQLKGRINEFHFKDNKGTLGEGSPVEAVAKAILEIGYTGWVIFERQHGKDRNAYFMKNAEISRKLLGLES
jgi:sugar phosphate isomerase/epimerase